MKFYKFAFVFLSFLLLWCSSYAKATRRHLEIWSELTQFESKTVQQFENTTTESPDSLLALYLLASGDVRDESTYLTIQNNIDQFIQQALPQLDTLPDDLAKAEKLHQLMHEHFFIKSKTPEQGYDFEQSKLSEVFNSGKFNCVSASMLYTILAHKVGLETQSALMPSHVFVELKVKDGSVVAVETTSPDGFGWKHNKEFYERNQSAQWFSSRGLSPATYQDYLDRQIISATALGIQNFKNQHVSPEKMDYPDRMRLIEILSVLSKDDWQTHKARLAFYSAEFDRLSAKNAFSELTKMYDKITPFLERLSRDLTIDIELQNLIAWVLSQKAYSLAKQGDYHQASQSAKQQISVLSHDLPDFDAIQNNLLIVFGLYLEELLEKNQFKKAETAIKSLSIQCVVDETCINLMRNIYAKWANHYWNLKAWDKAILSYREYLQIEKSSKAANLFLENMQSAYLNWSIEFIETKNWAQAIKILNDCIERSPSAQRCKARLVKVEAHLNN